MTCCIEHNCASSRQCGWASGSSDLKLGYMIFSPLWAVIWVLMLPAWIAEYLHCVHLCLFCPVWVSTEQMPLKMWSLAEWFVALQTFVVLSSTMSSQSISLICWITALFALMLRLPSVGEQMTLQIWSMDEWFVALCTIVLPIVLPIVSLWYADGDCSLCAFYSLSHARGHGQLNSAFNLPKKASPIF